MQNAKRRLNGVFHTPLSTEFDCLPMLCICLKFVLGKMDIAGTSHWTKDLEVNLKSGFKTVSLSGIVYPVILRPLEMLATRSYVL